MPARSADRLQSDFPRSNLSRDEKHHSGIALGDVPAALNAREASPVVNHHLRLHKTRRTITRICRVTVHGGIAQTACAVFIDNLDQDAATNMPGHMPQWPRAHEIAVLSEMSARGPREAVSTSESPAIATYLQSLAPAWKDGEKRPTHQRKATEARWWRTRADPFEHAWPDVEGWLVAEPTATAKELTNRLAQAVPDTSASKAQLRTLQRRIKTWRAEKANDLILGKLRHKTHVDAEVRITPPLTYIRPSGKRHTLMGLNHEYMGSTGAPPAAWQGPEDRKRN